MEQLPFCSVGLYLQTEAECHKTCYTENLAINKDLKNVGALKSDLQDLLRRRIGFQYSLESTDTLCLHHEKCLLDNYEILQKACCDPYQKHKSRVRKSLRVVDIAMSEKLAALGLDVKPGLKMCRNCFKRKTAPSDDEVSTANDDDNDPDFILPADQLNVALSTSFPIVGCSPVKLSKYPKRQRASYLVQNVKKLETVILSAVAPETDPMSIAITDANCSKCSDLDAIVSELKEKCLLVSKQQQIQLLTLAPNSWSIKRAAEEFQVSEYLVRQARALKQTSGILSMPEQRRGKCLPDEVVKSVFEFYQEDEVSRVCPGKKECISVKIDGCKQQKQKRLLLGNLKELYLLFKQKQQSKLSSFANSVAQGSVISFSKFCELRPKRCIMAGTSGSHSVCVCTIHQNVKLMLAKLGKECNYHQCIDKIVCSSENKDCMIHRCQHCPGTVLLEEYLTNQLVEDSDRDDLISFNQWVTTDRTTLVMHQMTVEEFVTEIVSKIDKLTVHEYISKHQSRYLTELKSVLSPNECIVLLDFAENYSFIVQDAAQGYHWENTQATLHPFVVYYREDMELKCTSFCCISNHMKHDTVAVYVFQSRIIEHMKKKIPGLAKVYYFSDGCAGQYKNLKNFANLCHHEEDYNISAEWNFFATSHGKSACDGIGGTVKRLAARASLQRPLTDPILTPNDLYSWCSKNIENITFFFVDSSAVLQASVRQENRFAFAKPVPGTRSFHWFVPISTTELQVGYISGNVANTLGSHQAGPTVVNLQPGQFVACVYDGEWWLGNVLEICTDNNDAKISFMHPHGPAASFFWPLTEDICWVPTAHLLCHVSVPSTTGSGRQYTLDNVRVVSDAWQTFNSMV